MRKVTRMKNMTKICEDVREIMHEWHTPKAERILHEMGVSKRMGPQQTPQNFVFWSQKSSSKHVPAFR